MSVDLRPIGNVLTSFQHIIQHLNDYSSGSNTPELQSSSLENLIRDFVQQRTAFEEMVGKLLSRGFNSAEVREPNFLNNTKNWTDKYVLERAVEQLKDGSQAYFELLTQVDGILAEFRGEVNGLNPLPPNRQFRDASTSNLETLWQTRNVNLLKLLSGKIQDLSSQIKISKRGLVSTTVSISKQAAESFQREEKELGSSDSNVDASPSFAVCKMDSSKCRAGSLVLYKSLRDLRLRWLLTHVTISGNDAPIPCCWAYCAVLLASIGGFAEHALNCESLNASEYRCLDQLERAWYDDRPSWPRLPHGNFHGIDIPRRSSGTPKRDRWSQGPGQHEKFAPAEEVPLSPPEPENDQIRVDRVEFKGIVLARKSMIFVDIHDTRDLQTETQHLLRLKHFHILQVFGSYEEFDNDRYAVLLYPYCEYTLSKFMSLCEIASPKKNDSKALVSQNADRMLRRLYLESFFPCLAQALRFIYSQATRHMDIKPSNILVKDRPQGVQDGRVFHIFIADFGISSTFTDFAKTQTEGSTGKTPKYCAPEVVPPPESKVANVAWGTRADVFSLGCVFSEMLTTIACRRRSEFDKFRRGNGPNSNFYAAIPRALEWLSDLSAFKDDYRELGDQARLYWYRRGQHEAFDLWHETFSTTVEITKSMLEDGMKRPRVSALCLQLKTDDCCCGETLPLVRERAEDPDDDDD